MRKQMTKYSESREAPKRINARVQFLLRTGMHERAFELRAKPDNLRYGVVSVPLSVDDSIMTDHHRLYDRSFHLAHIYLVKG